MENQKDVVSLNLPLQKLLPVLWPVKTVPKYLGEQFLSIIQVISQLVIDPKVEIEEQEEASKVVIEEVLVVALCL